MLTAARSSRRPLSTGWATVLLRFLWTCERRLKKMPPSLESRVFVTDRRIGSGLLDCSAREFVSRRRCRYRPAHCPRSLALAVSGRDGIGSDDVKNDTPGERYDTPLDNRAARSKRHISPVRCFLRRDYARLVGAVQDRRNFLGAS